MARVTTRKIGLEMDARLYAKLSKVAEQNGQSRRFLLEKALEHYLEVVVPSQTTVRPEVMKHFRRSTEKNRKLHQLLAQ
jgi:metal-responsive CopG/Arc/MetJ family transcriptional regulator